MRFELSTKPSTSLGLHQSVWSFHRTPAMCIEFWLDLANVYKVLLRTTALPRWATDHTSAIEHDELRRSVDLPGCLSCHRRRRFDQLGGRTKKLVQSKSVKWSMRRRRQQINKSRPATKCMEFLPETSNVYEVLVGSGQCIWSFEAHHCPTLVSDSPV